MASSSERVVADRCELSLIGPEHPDADPVTTPRAAVVCLDPEARACTFDEVELSWGLETACREAERCLRCDYGKIPVESATASAAPTTADAQGEVK
jgi:hypothetical protein